jgi:flagellar FliL protein
MAEDIDDNENEDVSEEKSGGGKKLLLIGLPLLLLGGAAGAYYSGLISFGEDASPVEEQANVEEREKLESIAFLQIPDMIVNLSSEDGQPRYLRLSVQLEMSDESDKAAVEAVMPRVIDQFQTYLRELRVADLRGSAGIYRLQMELLNRVNAAAYPVKVDDVLFQEILIQ